MSRHVHLASVKPWWRWWGVVGVIAGAQAAPVGAFGLLEKSTHWDITKPIEFTVNLAHVPASFTSEQYVDAVRTALDRWRQVDTAELPFRIGGVITDESQTTPEEDGVNMIAWKPGFVPRDLVAGKAFPFESECDIILAPRPPFGLIDIQGIVMHELGHCMGLAHSTAPGIMTKFTGLPAVGYDDRVAVSLRYPNRRKPLEEDTARVQGKVTRKGKPVIGAVIQVFDGATGRMLVSGFSGLVEAQQRRATSGLFELPGLPPGRHWLQVQPMDVFVAADPDSYGVPGPAPEPFATRRVELPEMKAGRQYRVDTIAVE